MKYLITVTTAIFVAAKLAGRVTWSWWLVFSPVWGCVLLCFAFDLVVLLIAGIVMLIDHYKK